MQLQAYLGWSGSSIMGGEVVRDYWRWALDQYPMILACSRLEAIAETKRTILVTIVHEVLQAVTRRVWRCRLNDVKAGYMERRNYCRLSRRDHDR